VPRAQSTSSALLPALEELCRRYDRRFLDSDPVGIVRRFDDPEDREIVGLIAAGLAYPQTVSQVIYGNTNMWVVAAIAAGARWGWPSVLVLLKPSFAPFALVGARSRRWWAALALLALVSVPFGAMWVDYATAMRNSSLSWTYALVALPLMFVPLVAWLGRRENVRDQSVSEIA